ncbi:MAG: DEAD/DEAH box helicase, partial [Sphingomonas sp.]
AALQALRDRRARVCVATDVAARGIDLPTLSLVVHVELPRDAETLQHRSGRTGRAGKKGTAVLIVPFPRRRRVDMMLKGAKINAEWIPAPTAEDIRKNDRERLITMLLQPVEIEDEDRELATRLMAERTPEDIAASLVHMHRATMPQAEDLIDQSKQSVSDDRSQGPRAGFEDTVWFRMDIGRRQNADPRWILPLICRRGHITKSEIGAIRIGPNETAFEIPRAVASRFSAAIQRTAQAGEEESGVAIEAMQGAPESTARHAGGGGRSNAGAPRSTLHRAAPRGGPAPARKAPYRGNRERS